MVVERRMAFRGTVLCVTCSFWLIAVVGNVRSSLAEDDGGNQRGVREQCAEGSWPWASDAQER